MDSFLRKELTKKKKDIVKKGLDRFKDLSRLLESKSLITFYFVVNNK